MKGLQMDNIVTTAIVGTGQLEAQKTTTGTPIDELAQQLAVDPERRLLLTAGAWSIYRSAGYPAAPVPMTPPPAQTETLPPCSPKATQLLKDLLGGKHKEVLPEALARLQQCELRLPYELLPRALTIGRAMNELRPVLAAVVGERGRWLSSFNPAWSWVAQALAEAEQALPENAETIWQEGTTEQRRNILQRLRAIDTTRALEWLMAAWKQEKADVKVELLTSLETGLSADDEPFLEKALDDRSESVRTASASMLSLIPTSALRQRMLERADAMLTYSNGTLIAQPPTVLEKEWQRDGIVARAPRHIKEQPWWLLQVLAFIPPEHWEERFATDPTTLVTSLNLDAGELQVALVEGWANATLLHCEKRWYSPLWKWWLQQRLDESRLTRLKTLLSHSRVVYPAFSVDDLSLTLLLDMPQQEAENNVLSLISKPSKQPWTYDLQVLRQPWSKAFGDAYLQLIRDYVSSLNDQLEFNELWQSTLTMAAIALPPACFVSALQTWDIPEKGRYSQYWKQSVKTFTDLIKLRKRIQEEIQ
jgi:hypothetical protein